MFPEKESHTRKNMHILSVKTIYHLTILLSISDGQSLRTPCELLISCTVYRHVFETKYQSSNHESLHEKTVLLFFPLYCQINLSWWRCKVKKTMYTWSISQYNLQAPKQVFRNYSFYIRKSSLQTWNILSANILSAVFLNILSAVDC